MMPPRPLPYDWKDLRARLQARISDLLPQLGIADQARAGKVTPRNPTRDDRHPGSFVIWTGRDVAGAWRDYATGESGDVVDLIGYLNGLATRMDAYWWALEFLGLGRGEVRSAGQAEADRRRAARDRKAAEARREADEVGKSAELFAWWRSLAPIAGTLAETYLVEARGIDLSRLRHLPGALRFTPALDHIDLETGELTLWPCMVAAMTRGTRLAGVHRTWLASDGGGKAPVTRPKMMKGPARGAAIRLSAGPSGFSPTKAEAKNLSEPLILGEGIETTLSCAVARPDYRAWAAGSLSLMGAIDWPACASAVILLQDAMAPGSPAAEAFARVLAHWRAQAAGRPVKTGASRVGSDFNDWMRGEAA